jgi:hypothetical protein
MSESKMLTSASRIGGLACASIAAVGHVARRYADQPERSIVYRSAVTCERRALTILLIRGAGMGFSREKWMVPLDVE